MDINKFRDYLFKKSARMGIRDFELFHSEGESFKVNIFEGQIENYSVNTSRGMGFRVIKDGKAGYSYTEAFDERAADLLVEGALTNAAAIEDKDPERIYAGSNEYKEVNTYNEGLDSVREAEKINFAREMEEIALGTDSRVVRVSHCIVQSFIGNTRITNSAGIDISRKSNGIFAYVVPVVKEGEKVNTASAYRVSRDFKSMDAGEIAREAVSNSLAYLGAEQVESGMYPVVLRNEAAVDLLETFADVFIAERVQKGLSLLKGKTGTVIASEVVTLVDDPLMEGGMCSGAFDAEGVPAYTKNVIKEGKLETLLYNLKTAARDGVDTTANAARGSYASTIGTAPSNFYIKPHAVTRDDLFNTMGNGLYITELQGLHSGANSVSGDFSLAAKGFLVKNGRIDRPVEQITIAGNFFEILKDVQGTASDLRFGLPSSGGYYGSPSLLIRLLSVAGR